MHPEIEDLDDMLKDRDIMMRTRNKFYCLLIWKGKKPDQVTMPRTISDGGKVTTFERRHRIMSAETVVGTLWNERSFSGERRSGSRAIEEAAIHSRTFSKRGWGRFKLLRKNPPRSDVFRWILSQWMSNYSLVFERSKRAFSILYVDV